MKNKGQALITLLVAVAISILILTAITIPLINSGKNTLREKGAKKVYYGAESGLEHALLKLIRSPQSCSGTENFTLEAVEVTIIYTQSSGTCQITSEASTGNIVKKLTAEGSYDLNQIFNYCCWKEIP